MQNSRFVSPAPPIDAYFREDHQTRSRVARLYSFSTGVAQTAIPMACAETSSPFAKGFVSSEPIEHAMGRTNYSPPSTSSTSMRDQPSPFTSSPSDSRDATAASANFVLKAPIARVSRDNSLAGRNVDGLIPQGLIHYADAVRRWPNETVDLIHLPGLVAAPKGRTGFQNDVRTFLRIVPAVDPASERGSQEGLDCCTVVVCVVLGDPDRVLQHGGADVVEVDDVQIDGWYSSPVSSLTASSTWAYSL